MRKLRNMALLLVCAGATTAMIACDWRQPPSVADPSAQVSDRGTELARAGAVSIGEQEFERLLRAVRASDLRADDSVERLEEVVRRVLLTRALGERAREQGLHRDPVIRDRIDRILRDELIASKVDAGLRPADFSDEQIETYYSAHEQDFKVPASASAHWIWISKSSDAEGARDRAAAVAELARQHSTSVAEFTKLVRENSEDLRTKAAAGYLGVFRGDTLDGEPLSLEQRSMRDALLELDSIGEIAGPVETPEGFAVLRLSGRRAAVSRSLEQVREELRHDLYKRERKQRLDALIAAALPDDSTSIDRQALVKFAARPPAARYAGTGKPPLPPIPGVPSPGAPESKQRPAPAIPAGENQ